MEQITKEEMEAGSQPTRLEKIMLTPLEEILAKETWDDIDVEVLVRNQHRLSPEVLERLGITKPRPLTPEEVQAQTDALGPVPTEVAPVAEETQAETATPEVVTAPASDTVQLPTEDETVDNQPAQ